MRKTILILAMVIVAFTIPAYARDIQQQQSIQLPGEETNACEGGPCDIELPPEDGNGGGGAAACYVCSLNSDGWTVKCYNLPPSNGNVNGVQGYTGCTAHNSSMGPNGCVLTGGCLRLYRDWGPGAGAPATDGSGHDGPGEALQTISDHVAVIRQSAAMTPERYEQLLDRIAATDWLPLMDGLLRAEEIYRAEVSALPEVFALIGRDLEPGEIVVIPQRRQ